VEKVEEEEEKAVKEVKEVKVLKERDDFSLNGYCYELYYAASLKNPLKLMINTILIRYLHLIYQYE
jgi:phage terminase small subunit